MIVGTFFMKVSIFFMKVGTILMKVGIESAVLPCYIIGLQAR